MGCKNIYLFGNDLNNKKLDYFDSVKLSQTNKTYNEQFYDKVYLYLKNFRKDALNMGSTYILAQNTAETATF